MLVIQCQSHLGSDVLQVAVRNVCNAVPSLTPAAAFALPVVRRPGPGVATALGGGYLASGAGDAVRLPTPWLPDGLKLDPEEGAGEDDD